MRARAATQSLGVRAFYRRRLSEPRFEDLADEAPTFLVDSRWCQWPTLQRLVATWYRIDQDLELSRVGALNYGVLSAPVTLGINS